MNNFNRNDRSRGSRGFSRGNFGRDRFGDGKREMFKVVCADCGQDCEVPFEPNGRKPVYCNDCFRKNNSGRESRSFRDRSSGRREFVRRDESRPQNNEQMNAINRKLDKIIEMLTAPLEKLSVKTEKTEKTEEVVKPVKVDRKSSKKKTTEKKNE